MLQIYAIHWRNHIFLKNILMELKRFLLLQRVSLIRPAPTEIPQDRKVARVGGCSGAIYVLTHFFYPDFL